MEDNYTMSDCITKSLAISSSHSNATTMHVHADTCCCITYSLAEPSQNMHTKHAVSSGPADLMHID